MWCDKFWSIFALQYFNFVQIGSAAGGISNAFYEFNQGMYMSSYATAEAFQKEESLKAHGFDQIQVLGCLNIVLDETI